MNSQKSSCSSRGLIESKLPPNTRDLTSLVFNCYTVQAYAGYKPRLPKGKIHFWLCRCACGSLKIVRAEHLVQGAVKSCGCHRLKVLASRTTHGKSAIPEYKILASMIQRCNNPNNPAWANYGGRGITVDPAWQARGGIVNFLNDMGPRPSRMHSVERVNNSKGYNKENCIWALAKVQNKNRRIAINVVIDGETRSLRDWADKFGIVDYRAVLARLRAGWPVRAALTLPPVNRGDRRHIPRLLIAE